jgi:hypothetical protein
VVQPEPKLTPCGRLAAGNLYFEVLGSPGRSKTRVREATRSLFNDEDCQALNGGDLRDFGRVGKPVQQGKVTWREIYLESFSFVAGVAAVLEPYIGSAVCTVA